MAVQTLQRLQQIEAIKYDGSNIREIDGWIGLTHESTWFDGEDGKPRFRQVKINCAVGWVNLYPGQYVVKSNGAFFVWNAEELLDKFEFVESSQE